LSFKASTKRIGGWQTMLKCKISLVDAGGLMSYGADDPALFRLAQNSYKEYYRASTKRFTHRATREIRVGHQLKDCEGHGSHDYGDFLASR
jgi:hypothetical protein